MKWFHDIALSRVIVCGLFLTLASCNFKFPGGQTVCLGTGSFPTTFGLERVPSYMFPIYNSSYYQVDSIVMCAAIAKTEKAVTFDYKDGNCSIHGRGESLTDGEYFMTGDGLPTADRLEEVAQLKPIAASPHYTTPANAYLASKANDGLLDEFSGYNSDNDILHPYWVVDLEEEKEIYQVQIFPREFCCEWRNDELEVLVGMDPLVDEDFSSYTLFSKYIGPYDLSQGILVCSSLSPFKGRYVAIRRYGLATDSIGLREVQVYALK